MFISDTNRRERQLCIQIFRRNIIMLSSPQKGNTFPRSLNETVEFVVFGFFRYKVAIK